MKFSCRGLPVLGGIFGGKLVENWWNISVEYSDRFIEIFQFWTSSIGALREEPDLVENARLNVLNGLINTRVNNLFMTLNHTFYSPGYQGRQKYSIVMWFQNNGYK